MAGGEGGGREGVGGKERVELGVGGGVSRGGGLL